MEEIENTMVQEEKGTYDNAKEMIGNDDIKQAFHPFPIGGAVAGLIWCLGSNVHPTITKSPPPSGGNIRPYRYPHAQKMKIEKQVDTLLASGFIQPSTNPFSSPVLLVKKKDATWCICVDYRALNKITIADKYLILNIHELLDKLYGATIFSKIVLRSNEKVSFLGHIVLKDGVQVDQDKVVAVESWPLPSTVKEVHRFLGLAGYYRRLLNTMVSSPVLLLVSLKKMDSNGTMRLHHWSSFLAWAEYSCNIGFHTSIRMTPFNAVYGRDPPTLYVYVLSETNNVELETQLIARDQMLQLLRAILQKAQDHMKVALDQKCRELTFQVGDVFFLRIQPYRHTNLAKWRFEHCCKNPY
ncbi:hypothetical protein E3N88_23420 [Mikania micrantha]|uniref:Reverse transcriptase/retrotransposon-derived protein RNase H-like domain-containing protein n=1 Tax=Mikania micrantha TaxID=192012 RepID=A0A5N6NED2_9ASTR|nr:hypothetical protein E3N88_23420 [Mikania micrantha]